MVRKLLALGVLLLLTAPLAAQTATVEVKDAWARATPGAAENGGAYMTLVSPTADRLTGVSTPVAKKAELHMMTMAAGVMRMSPLAAVDLPAGQPVTLKPGAMHIMLVGLNKPLVAGQSFPLTLSFEKAGAREVTVKVEKVGAMGPGETAGGMQMPMPMHSGH